MIRPAVLAITGIVLATAAGTITHTNARASASVTLVRVPHGGIQPEVAIDLEGVLHLIYFEGTPAAGNLFYVRSQDAGATFSAPVRVNSQAGSAVAIGTIRGGQLAIGRGGRVHVAWNGSDAASPRGLPNPADGHPSAPLLYARSNPTGTSFEPQRNLMTRSVTLDGGGSIGADAAGRVYAAWHALEAGRAAGEDQRVVWVARSDDDGATFAPERPAWHAGTGACGCCALRIAASAADREPYVLFRAATTVTDRDMYVLVSDDHARTFRGSMVQPWRIASCQMTSMSLAPSGSRMLGAWETGGQVQFGAIDRAAARIPAAIAPPGEPGTRKHPRLTANAQGQILLVWTEGTGWARGGSLAWQIFDSSLHPTGEHGSASGIPVWSFGSAVARRDGGFLVFY
jgi:hypothetical protein